MSANNLYSRHDNQTLAWLVCFAATLFFFYEFIQGTMFNSISSDVMRSFGIGVEENSYLSSVYYVSNVLFLFPAGILLDRFSTKKIIITALSLCIGGTFLFAFAEHFALAFFCRFITGIGSAFCFLACIRLASRWFPADKMALVSGLIVTMAMSGGMVAQAPMTYLLTLVGWRATLCYDGVLGLIILVLIMRFVKDSPNGHNEPRRNVSSTLGFFAGLRAAYFNGQNLLAAMYTSLMNMPVVILGAMAGSLFLTQAVHFTQSDASYISSVLFLGAILGGPAIGAISDKLGMRRGLMVITTLLSLLVTVCLLLTTSQSREWWMVLFFLLGFFTSGQVLSYPLVAESNAPEITATAVSVVSVVTMSGFVVFQNLFGKQLATHWQGVVDRGINVYSIEAYHHALMILPVGMLLALLAALLLRNDKSS